MVSAATNFILKVSQITETDNIILYNDETKVELLANVKYLDGSVSDDLKVMEHPIESGATIADHVVDDAKSANVKLLIQDEDIDSLNKLLDCYKKRTPIAFRIKNEFYKNFIISSKPLKADVKYFDSTLYELTLKEVMVAQTQYVKMTVPQAKQPKNASTVKSGQKQAQPQAQKKVTPSILRQGFNKITGKK